MSGEDRAQEIQRRVAEGDLVVVHRLHDQFEGQAIELLLDGHDIPHDIRRNFETAFSFLFVPQRGFGVVIARASDAVRVRELIGEMLADDAKHAAAAAEVEAEASISDEAAPIQDLDG